VITTNVPRCIDKVSLTVPGYTGAVLPEGDNKHGRKQGETITTEFHLNLFNYLNYLF